LQGSKKNSDPYYFIDPISLVGSGTSNIAVCQVKPQGSSRNIFQKSFENQKFKFKRLRQTKLQLIPPKKGRNMLQITRENQYLPSSMNPNVAR
jgi:hypothetical protein